MYFRLVVSLFFLTIEAVNGEYETPTVLVYETVRLCFLSGLFLLHAVCLFSKIISN